VLGVDPDPARLWPEPTNAGGVRAHGAQGKGAAELAAAAVVAHCRALISAAAPACVAVKLQLARFEALGETGRSVLGAVATHARSLGLLVIADGKRGDIEVSSRAYASALFDGLQTPFGTLDGLHADLATVNPLLGRDALEPFVSAARTRGAGVLALVRTSNEGAAEIQDLRLEDGGAVWERLAEIVDQLGAEGIGAAGLSDVGAVIGATAARLLERARELMPSAVFLLPGVGTQGGRVEDLAAAFAPGWAGGLVSASRSISEAHACNGAPPAAAARAAAERLRETAWSLAAR